MIKDYATNKLPVYIGGKYNFVDVRDVVHGLIQSWKVGKRGESYILSGEEMSLEQFFDILSNLEPSMKKPKIKFPVSLALGSAWVLELTCKVFSIKPLFTAYAVKVLQSNCNFCNENSKADLGYNPRSIKETIKDSLIWLKENNQI
jgi:dihydroflavonol-4-reductase